MCPGRSLACLYMKKATRAVKKSIAAIVVAAELQELNAGHDPKPHTPHEVFEPIEPTGHIAGASMVATALPSPESVRSFPNVSYIERPSLGLDLKPTVETNVQKIS